VTRVTSDRERPGGIWAVGIAAIVLAVLGGCGGVYQLGTVVLQDVVIDAMERAAQAGEGDGGARGRSLEVQRRSLEVARAYRVPTVATQVANLISAFVLLLAAVLLFHWHPNAVAVFLVAVALSALVDLANGALGVIVSLETIEALSDVARTGDAAQNQRLGAAVAASGSLGICWAIGWCLVKLGTYAGATAYLRRGRVRALFS